LQPEGDSPEYLRELRLQNMDRLDLGELHHQADLADSSKLRRAAALASALSQNEAVEYQTL
jgi:hypothetical protein